MSSLIENFRHTNVLVLGDVMLDRYWNGSTERVSPEAPVPVVKVNNTFERLGGSGNVAANIASLGARAELACIVGHDEAGEAIANLAEKLGIKHSFVFADNYQTPIKLRVISQQQQLIRVDFEDVLQHPAKSELSADMEAAISNAQALVISDYGKGAIPDANAIIQYANRVNVPVVVDPKGRDFNKYQNAHLITPNMKEFEAVVGPCANDVVLQEKGQNLVRTLGIAALLVTRGANGMSLIRAGLPMQHLRANAREVFDVTGAGDTVCAVCAVVLAAGGNLDEAIDLANSAAGIVVSKFGTATVSSTELAVARRTENGKRLNLQDASAMVNHQKSIGAKVVMTNGCFDVLHAGHVAYLRQARALGDYLLVAVNDDSSVSALKGAGRPFNQLADRLAVLEALEAVDGVIAFSEPTPLALIEALTPDVLVKGGDYTPTDIVGASHVTRHGGEVLVLPFLEGHSSSLILEKMQASNRGVKM